MRFLHRERPAGFAIRRALALCALCASASGRAQDAPHADAPSAEPLFFDTFDDLSAWQAQPSEGVEARLSSEPGHRGPCLRLDYDFRRGAGFVVVRRELPLELPENYRFSFWVRGEGPANNLELKLVSPSGDDVWWVNRRAYQPPLRWMRLTQRKRHFAFAWGPSAGAPLKRIGAIEFAIAAHEGGRGTIWLDELEAVSLPPESTEIGPAEVHYSSAAEDVSPILPTDGQIHWQPDKNDTKPWIELRFEGLRELGGVLLDWGAGPAPRYDVLAITDGKPAILRRAREVAGGRNWLRMPEAECEALRVRILDLEGWPAGAALRALRPLDWRFGDSLNGMLRQVAANSPRGAYPRPLLWEQAFWTVVGAPDDDREALLDEYGAIEVGRGAFRVEPLLWSADRLWTWADSAAVCSLEEGYLPIPSVHWPAPPVELTVTALADGAPGRSSVLVRYVLRNRTETAQHGRLLLAIRPFQALPPWQELNLTGGVAQIHRIARSDNTVRVDERVVRALSDPAGFATATFASGEIVERLRSGVWPDPSAEQVDDEDGLASAALRFDFQLAAGETREVHVEIPLHAESGAAPSPNEAPAYFERRLAVARDMWRAELNRVELRLPGRLRAWGDTWRSTLAYVLINADGPAIQPGSRTYERSWIRDGAMTSAALLAAGHAERVRDFIEWFAPNQFESGKVPCVVDRRGPDPVDEHDSTGEFLYLLAEYYRQTGDRELLERHFGQVERAVDYLDKLRQKRMTDLYRTGTPEQRACYGLVPESISHEGYSAKPMHSYWDSLWVLRGLKDAALIADVLGRDAPRARFERLRDEYRTALVDSIKLAMANTGVDYIPGCVELGDFDATSTAIAYFPCDEAEHLPQPALDHTFERYFGFFQRRRDGGLEWRDYTPYELRLMQTFTRRGEPQRARELGDWFFGHQYPPGWNHWAEVVHRDPRRPGYIGDMPHTWCGSAFMNALRSMLVYERSDALVLLAGATADWLSEGTPVGVARMPTHFGELNYSLAREGAELRLQVSGEFNSRLEGIVVCLPGEGEVRVSADPQGAVLGVEGRRLTVRPRRCEIRLASD